MTVWIDDLTLMRESVDFSDDPGWDGQGNRLTV